MYRTALLTKPLLERYIHGYIVLQLLDDPGVTPCDGDTTYKRIEGKINEWELSIFVKIALRGMGSTYTSVTTTDDP